MLGTYSSFLMPFIGVLLVVFLAYWGTKLISIKYNKLCTGRHMHVVERLPLGQEKSLLLITVNKKAYVLGVTGKDISTVCEFAESDLGAETSLPQTDFSTLLAGNFKKSSTALIRKTGELPGIGFPTKTRLPQIDVPALCAVCLRQGAVLLVWGGRRASKFLTICWQKTTMALDWLKKQIHSNILTTNTRLLQSDFAALLQNSLKQKAWGQLWAKRHEGRERE